MSLTYIDLTKPKSPRYVRKDHPKTFKTNQEKERYFGNELEKWYLGDKQSGLCGYHYFMLQEGWYYDQDNDEYNRLIWREADDKLIYELNQNRDNIVDSFIIKPRGFGLNTMVFTGKPVYQALTSKSSKIPVTSVDEDRVIKIEEDIRFLVKNLNPAFKIHYKKNKKDTEALIFDDEYNEYLLNEQKTTNRDTEIQPTGRHSSLLFASTETKSNVFDSHRINSAFIDEIFLSKKLKQTLQSLKHCLKSGGQKKGSFVAGGSSNAINIEATQNIKEILATKDKTRAVIFIPAGSGSNMFMVNGWDNPKKSEEHYLKEREEVYKACIGNGGNMDDYYDLVRSYPLKLEDCFFSNEKGLLGADTVVKLNEQSNKIILNTDIQYMPSKGELIEVNSNVIFQPNETGKWFVLNPPAPDCPPNVHAVGVDPTSIEHDNFSKSKDTRSDYAICVGNRATGSITAIYSEQVSSSEEAVEELRKALIWSKSKALIESGSSGGTTFLNLRNFGYQDRIARLPNFFGGNGSEGIAPTPKNKNDGRNYMESFIKNYGQNIWFPKLVDDLLEKYHLNKNADISMAFKWMCYLMVILDEIDKRRNKDNNSRYDYFKSNEFKQSKTVYKNGVFVIESVSKYGDSDLFM